MLIPTPVAAQPPATELQWLTLIMGLVGGLAFFLYGMEKMAASLQTVAGDRMRLVLRRLTSNRLAAAATGAFVTAIIQSSSVTTVMVVSFVSAGLLSLSQAVGVIMGANIGTTLTAQIIAFKVTKLAMVLIALGFFMTFTAKTQSYRTRGAGLMGLGLVFFGMAVMSDAMAPLRTYPPFLEWMVRLERPFLGILVGALFTALVQSSSATTGIVIVMASQGLISLPAGIALAFGANIGTCITALLAAIGRSREALRASVVHVLFNSLGVLIWLPLIGSLAELVVWLSPAAPELTGTARLAAETPRQIANAHTAFNLINTLLFLPLASLFARWSEKMVPDRPAAETAEVRPRYLDEGLLPTPSLALDRARLEILHQGEQVQEMLAEVIPAVLHGTESEIETIARMDDGVDALHGEIVTYLGKITGESLSQDQSQEVIKLMEATNSLENIGDIVETNLVRLGHERRTHDLRVSEATEEILVRFHATVAEAVDAAVQAVAKKDVEAARRVVRMKREVNLLADAAARHQAQRLIAPEPNRLRAYTLETDILQSLKRIFYFAKRMARAVVPSVGLKADS